MKAEINTTHFVQSLEFPDDLSLLPTTFADLNDTVIDKIYTFMREEFFELPANSQRALKNDFAQYYQFCQLEQLTCLSADIEESKAVLLAFVKHLATTTYQRRAGTIRHKDGTRKIKYETRTYKYSTIKRYVATIASIYRIAELPNPGDTDYCRRRIKRILTSNEIYDTPQSAHALRLRDLDLINATAPRDTLKHLRDLAMLNLAFDGLLRSDETIRVRLEDIDVNAQALSIVTSKTDQTGKKGQQRYISSKTLSFIQDYITSANRNGDAIRPPDDPKSLYQGVLFRSVSTNGKSLRPTDSNSGRTGALDHAAVVKAYKSLASYAGLKIKFSGHSPRVGGAVSLAENREDGLEIQRAGGWTTQAMPGRYTQRTRLKHSGMSRLRDQED